MQYEDYYDHHWLPIDNYFNIHRSRFIQSYHYLESFNLTTGGIVLDIGGIGPVSGYLRDYLAWQAEKVESDLRYPLNLDSDRYDLVICTETIEHVKDVDSDQIADLERFNYSGVVNMLSEFLRVMKPGGHLLVTTPNANSYVTLAKWVYGELLLMDPAHVREFSVRELGQVAASVGLETKNIATFDTWDDSFKEALAPIKPMVEHLPQVNLVERKDNIFALFAKP